MIPVYYILQHKLYNLLRNLFFFYICILYILNKSNSEPVPTHLEANARYESRQEICGTISTILSFLRKYISVRYGDTFTSDYSHPFLLVANPRQPPPLQESLQPLCEYSPLFYPEGDFFVPQYYKLCA